MSMKVPKSGTPVGGCGREDAGDGSGTGMEKKGAVSFEAYQRS
jgi:hypothetical protein